MAYFQHYQKWFEQNKKNCSRGCTEVKVLPLIVIILLSQTKCGHYLLMTKHYRYSEHVLYQQQDNKRLMIYFCFLESIWRHTWKCFVDDNRSSPDWIQNTLNVTWRWKNGLVKRKNMERKQHGSHWSVLLTRLFLSCCIVWQQRNHTRQGEGGAETTQRDYCSSDQTEMNRNKKGHRSTEYIILRDWHIKLLLNPSDLLADYSLDKYIFQDYIMNCQQIYMEHLVQTWNDRCD